MTDLVRRAGDALAAAELYALLRLRVEVFVVEQRCPYPELDDLDLLASTRHLWLSETGSPLAYLRVLDEGDGRLRIGRVCAAASARGHGLAGRLMAAAVESAPDAEWVLNAQTYARGFYARFGFRPEGREFDEDGIPHIAMRKRA